jgi:biofilm PGA synthesis N-glycosyltransferase PgaC
LEIALYILLILALVPLVILAMLPLWTLIRAQLVKRPVNKNAAFRPPVSVILVCYNEERYIENKVNSILATENWIPDSELIVVSGGSTDRTNEILRQFEDRDEVELILLEDRTWKIDGVNLAVARSKHDILVFSDCRQQMKEGSIQALVQNLHDPEVGTVSSSLCDSHTHEKASFFRSVLNFMSNKSSESDSCFNVFGALYAQRKSVFREIPKNLLFDDLFVVVSTLNQGKRVIQEQEAVIYDVEFDTYYQKERIRRLVRGLLIFLTNQSRLIFSLPTNTLIRFLVYKYLKLLMPFFILTVLLASGALLTFERVVMSNALVPALIIASFLIVFRKQLLLFIRINVQIFFAVLAFVFKSERSNKWEKLKTSVTK